jgi:murein DD-endopeptidase MepM/ murein hydrolase activator NlpD
MKSKFYTIFIASDKDEYGKSFRVSSIFLKALAFFGIVIAILSTIGFLRLIGKDKLTNELSELRSFKHQAEQLIKDVYSISDSTGQGQYEKMLSTLFAKQDSILPVFPPVDGYVTQGLNLSEDSESHNGIDVAAAFGADIKSPAKGMIVFSGKGIETGNTIIISHDFGFYTLYGHNDTNLVRERDIVAAGQVIAKVGDTGESDGPHLHFEIWKNNRVLDPRDLIKEYKKKDVSIR